MTCLDADAFEDVPAVPALFFIPGDLSNSIVERLHELEDLETGVLKHDDSLQGLGTSGPWMRAWRVARGIVSGTSGSETLSFSYQMSSHPGQKVYRDHVTTSVIHRAQAVCSFGNKRRAARLGSRYSRCWTSTPVLLPSSTGGVMQMMYSWTRSS